MENVHSGHRKRVKEEFRKNGLSHFPQHRIIELLLFYCIPRGDTNEIAHRLINRFGSLSGVLDASPELLCQVDGIGQEAATFFKLLVAANQAYLEDRTSHDNIISDPESAKRYMEYKFLGETAECLYFAGLGNNGKVLFCDMVAQGTPDTVSISPSSVVRAAVHANAVKAVMAHNHPYGICNPSNQDLQTTRILTEELARVGVELIDHIIVAADGVCSMRETRMMGPLR